MIHTATFIYPASEEFFQAFIGVDGTKYIKQESYYLNDKFKDVGIIIKGKRFIYKGYNGRNLFVRVNFKKLLTKDYRTEILLEKDLEDMEQAFNDVMEQLHLPWFMDWNIYRIDYCINLKTPYVKKYIKLLQKGDKPHFLGLTYNEQRNYTAYNDSVYYVNRRKKGRHRKTITINFYDKQQELLQRQKDGEQIPDEVIEQAQDILRLEVQCHRGRLDYIKAKENLQDKKAYRFMSSNISYDVLESCLLAVAKKGDYYKKKQAIKIIKGSKRNRKTKEELLQLIDDIGKQFSSIHKIRTKYITTGTMDSNHFSSLLRILNDLNLNPVVIRDKDKVPPVLPSIYDLFFDTWNNPDNYNWNIEPIYFDGTEEDLLPEEQ